MPLEGILQDGAQIQLVPALKLNWIAQVLGGIVGAIGAASLGAGLGAHGVPSQPIPEEAIRAIADRCSMKGEHCNMLCLTQTSVGHLAAIIGSVLLFVQVGVLFWTGPRRRRPAQPPSYWLLASRSATAPRWASA